MNNLFKEKLIENSKSYGYVIDFNNYELIYINDYLLNRLTPHLPNAHEYQNKVCYEFLHNLKEPCIQCDLSGIKLDQSTQTHYHNFVNGEWFSVVKTLFQADSKEYLCHNAYNITNEINQISNLKEIIDDNKAIIDCAQTLLDNLTFETSINKLLKIICNYYGGEYARLFERDFDTQISTVTFKYHIEDTSLISTSNVDSFKFNKDDIWTTFLIDNNYALLQSSDEINKELQNSYYYERFLRSGNKNSLVVSLKDNNNILGAIEIDNISKNTEKIDFITTICAFVVNNLNMRNAHTFLKKNIYDLENKNTLNNTMLQCIKTLVYEDDDIDTSMNKLLDIVCNYFKAASTNIFYKKDNVMVTCKYSFAVDKPVEEVVIQDLPIINMINLFNHFNKDGVGYIDKAERLLGIPDVDFTMDYQIWKDKSIDSLFITPLMKNDEFVGFLGVENPSVNLNETTLVKTISTFIINHINKNELLTKLEKLSYMDSLTGLYNRNFYNSYIDEFKSSGKQSVGIIFADVNGLKKANDNFGHELGDKLIKWSAKFLQKYVKGLIFRIGGDEFVCILEDIDELEFNKVLETLSTEIKNYGEVHISIGNTWDKDSSAIESLIAKADENMYAKKQAYYKEISEDDRTVRVALQDLRKSIENLVL